MVVLLPHLTGLLTERRCVLPALAQDKECVTTCNTPQHVFDQGDCNSSLSTKGDATDARSKRFCFAWAAKRTGADTDAFKE